MEKELLANGTEISTESYLSKIKQLEGVSHMIAHNLRGAGGNIKMLAEVLQKKQERGGADDDDEDEFTTKEAIDYIVESSTSLLHTLNTLMEVADIKLAEDVPYDSCDMEGIVSEIVLQLHGLMHKKHSSIELNLQAPYIRYPYAYMESILYNFINNALKYSPQDRPLHIIVTTSMADGRPVLSVKDNGLGIDLEKYGNRMFQPRQVFHNGYESKGFGLYITRTQIESLGGKISVKSKVGEGSEFIVRF